MAGNLYTLFYLAPLSPDSRETFEVFVNLFKCFASPEAITPSASLGSRFVVFQSVTSHPIVQYNVVEEQQLAGYLPQISMNFLQLLCQACPLLEENN